MIFKSITKRKIQVVLGVLWLIDGFLQLQHQMFTVNFARTVIDGAATGQPLIVAGPIHIAVHLITAHPAIYDTIFILIQLLIGILILNKKTVRQGLILSCLWGVGVWYFGEGMGGILSGNTNLIMGAPGAVIIYVILALAVMPNSKEDQTKTHPAFWLPIFWGLFWIGGAIYQLLPGQNSASDLASMLNINSVYAPHYLASLDNWSARQVTLYGFKFIWILALVEFLIGVFIFMPKPYKQVSLLLGSILAIVFWVLGQSLGGYFTGLMTDPNSGPLFVILAITILGCPILKNQTLFKRSWVSLEKFIT